MVALDTFICIGDESITGGAIGVKPSTELPVAWGAGRLLTTFHRFVPAAGSAYAPYWDGHSGDVQTSTGAGATTIVRAGAGWTVNAFAGLRIHIDSGPGSGDDKVILSNTADTITVDTAWSVNPTASDFHVGTGKFLKFWHTNSLSPNIPFNPTSKGDNWHELGGGITPVSMLMQSLGDQYGVLAPGFRFFKFAQVHGAAGWKLGGPAYNEFQLQWQRAVDYEAALGNTLNVKVVIWDGSTRDISGLNLNYGNDAQSIVDWCTSQFGADVLVIIVNHHARLFHTSLPGAALTARHENRLLMSNNANVRLYDMGWGKFAPAFPLGPEPADPAYYDTETYLQAGVGLYRLIRAYFTVQPVIAPGSGVAVLQMIGDSQMVTIPTNPLMLLYSDQASLIGEGPGTILPGVWVYNWQMEMIEPFDALSNSNSLPDVFSYFGPDVTCLSDLRARFPNGIVLFKWAKGTRSVTYEAVAAGVVQAFEKDAPGSAYDEIKDGWEKCRIAIMRDLGLTPDVIGRIYSIENDGASDESVAAFAVKASIFVDDYAELLDTRTTGEATPTVWLQPPPPVATTAGGSVLHTTERREAVRATIASLATTKSRFRVRLNTGQYELTRTDDTHYGGHAVLNIGEDLAEDLIALIDSDEGETEETGTLPSETAAFVVEDGSGLPSANALVSVEFVDTYAKLYGNPATWSQQTPAAKKDFIRQASSWISLRYTYMGRKAQADQGLAFPRFDLHDEDGYFIEGNEVPRRVQEATAVVATKMSEGWQPFPDEESDAGKVSSSVQVGPISVSDEYAGPRVASTETRLVAVERLLRPFMRSMNTLGRA